MGSYMGSIGMWYKDGIFYELENRHINFFLKHPEILGFSEEEKQKLCESNGLPADAIYCDESDPARNRSESVSIETALLFSVEVRRIVKTLWNSKSVFCLDGESALEILYK